MYCGYKLFADCKGLTEIPSMSTLYGNPTCYENMFENCTGITSIEIADNTTIISANQYLNCEDVKIVYYNNQEYRNNVDLIFDLEENNVYVGDNAFLGIFNSDVINSSSSNFGSNSFNSYFNSL
jgi:hypothetical protein